MLSPRIAALSADPTPPAVDRFWAEVTRSGTPLIEPYDDGHHVVTFLWRGEANTIRAWFNIDVPLTRLPKTDLWYGSTVFPSDLRTIYCLTHDGAEQIPRTRTDTTPALLDPTNPRVLHFPADPADPTDVDAWTSVLELPGAPPPAWTEHRPETPRGHLETKAFTSTALNRDVQVTAYLPARTGPAELPAIVVFDGYLGRTMMRIPTVLDNLIAGGHIPPMAALFLHNRDEHRIRDLTPGEPVEQLVVGELLPWARRTWRVGSPGSDVIAGMSRGGLVATHLALRHPDLFQSAIAHSGSFWWPSPDAGTPGRLIREVTRTPPTDVHFYLDVGLLESMPGPDGAPSQLTACRRMSNALTTQGFHLTYREYAGGHDYINWQQNFAKALLATISKKP
ncbi:MAG TPA: alpha/beta hydrolase-fold protein [Actinoplanes sp.]|nr:alpha/beta hydrolase-fold protein [Actinoplanes sp.]